jgi:hypothetical protein
MPNGCRAAISRVGSAACEKWPEFLDFRWMQNVHSGGKFAVQDRPGKSRVKKWGEEIVKSEDNSSALALKEPQAVPPIGNRPEREVTETNDGDGRPATL